MDNTHLDSARPGNSRTPPQGADPLHDVRSLGEYRIMRRLGEGGMGSVYLAYHEGRDQQVALKILGDHLASNQGYVDRFYREAKSGSLLNHPNIVRTLNVGQDKATAKHYLVLEFVDGPSAHALLARHGRLSVGDAVHIGLDIARALEHAHSRNIVHRDIKPDNILITRSGIAKLVDLGLAKRTDETSHLTAARQGFGTTHYMPYEQAINARHADGRSDIYALGATLYHLVTGAVPFPGTNHLEVVELKNLGEFKPASMLNPEVPPALDQILARMLARHPRDRYQTASELIVDLERSHLAAHLPSFADPALAMQDSWVQACLASSEPTRPDPLSLAAAKVNPDVWLLRYRDRQGKLCKARSSTQEIIKRLHAGRLPAALEVRHPGQKGFRPVGAFSEFQAALAARPPERKRPRRKPRPSSDSASTNGRTAQRRRWPGPLVLGLGALALVLVLFGIVAFWLLRS
jgi:serine/threonine-protein kinase